MIGALQTSEFLYEASLFPELEYTFKHALIHEVAYGSLLQERRKALHARVADAIEATYADRLAEHVERLAHHVLRAESWQQAVVYSGEAGRKASTRSADREAVAYFEQALEALRHLPDTRENLEHAIEIRLAMRPSLMTLGEIRRIGDHLREALTIAGALGDQRRLGRISAVMTNYFFATGKLDQAVEVGRRAVAVGEAIGDLSIQVTATEMLGNVYATGGAFHLAIDGYRWILAILRGDLLHERFGLASYPALSARHKMAVCLAELGELAEGAALAEEAVRLAEAPNRPSELAHALSDLGRLYLRRGDLPKAIPVLERAVALGNTQETPGISIRAMSSLGAAYTLGGRVGEAVPLLEQAVDQVASTRGWIFDSLPFSHLGEAYLANGQIEDAVQTSQQALDRALAHGERGSQAFALRLLGAIAARRLPPEPQLAEAQYREALALATDLGMRPLQAHCHLDLGKLYRRTGRADEAHAELATAATLLREMGMNLWLPEAEAELAETSR